MVWRAHRELCGVSSTFHPLFRERKVDGLVGLGDGTLALDGSAAMELTRGRQRGDETLVIDARFDIAFLRSPL